MGHIWLFQNWNFLHFLDLLGTVAFAVWWAYKAKSRWLNIFAVIFLWTITAVWWGTIRDLIIWRIPLFYINNSIYIILTILSWVIVYTLPNFFKKTYSIFRFIDSIWLAAFSIIWTNITYIHLFSNRNIFDIQVILICIFLWILTWVGWWILRDSILWDTPYSFKSHSNYITSAFFGSAIYLLFSNLNIFFSASFSLIFVMIFRELLSPYGIYKKLVKTKSN